MRLQSTTFTDAGIYMMPAQFQKYYADDPAIATLELAKVLRKSRWGEVLQCTHRRRVYVKMMIK